VALAARVLDAKGAAMAGIPVVWASSDPRVATVDPALGLVRGLGPGATRITAKAGSVTAGVMVTVVAPRDSAVVATSDRSRSQPVTGPEPAAPPPPNATGPSPAPAPAPKTEGQLRAEIQTLLASYAHAIELRDTALIRRVFPSVEHDLLKRWQTTFDDARGPIAMTSSALEIVDPPRDVAGAQVRVQAKYVARFSSRVARSDQSFPVTFTAVLQRDGGAWRIASIR